MARVYRAHRSIDRSIDPLSIVLARPWQKKRDGEQWRTRLERGSWVGGASGFVPDHRQLFDSVRSLQSRFNDRHRSRSFSATSRARNARSNVLPRTTRRSTGHVYTLANTCSSQLQFPPTMYRSFPRRFELATSFRGGSRIRLRRNQIWAENNRWENFLRTDKLQHLSYAGR